MQLLPVGSAGLSNDPNRITSDLQDGARAAIQTGPEQTHTACGSSTRLKLRLVCLELAMGLLIGPEEGQLILAVQAIGF